LTWCRWLDNGHRAASAPVFDLDDLAVRAAVSADPALHAAAPAILESFVVGEVLKQVSWAEEPLEVGHFRTHDGVEADIVIEGSDARIAAIEVKAASQVRPTDLRGLRLLRDRFPDRFVGGTVLYLGPLAYTAEDRIHVVPLDHLWM